MRAVTIYGTSECNLRCKHCGVGRDQLLPRPQLSTDDLKRILSRLGEAQVRFVTLLGGEVTLYRDDLPELLDHAKAIGLEMAINTNLTNVENVEPLLDCEALTALIVSFDGASSETHDVLRGRGTFEKTKANAIRISGHPRIQSRELVLQVACVLTAVNLCDASRIVPLAREVGSRRLSVKPVKITGRARQFEQKLALPTNGLLEAYELLVVSWLLDDCSLELDLHLPPLAAIYFNGKWGTNFPLDNHAACGGIDSYGYVDAYGNLMPCPASAFEQNPSQGMSSKRGDINLLENDVSAVKQTAVFRDFEGNRLARKSLNQMLPCKNCTFNSTCFPCTSDFLSGADEAKVDICHAISEHGRHVPGVVSSLGLGPLAN